jgi:hypothetical protein
MIQTQELLKHNVFIHLKQLAHFWFQKDWWIFAIYIDRLIALLVLQ